jgi:hypothetical protein
MSSISSTSSNFLQSSSNPGGNWLQDSVSASASSADWMDPNASGQDAVSLAANAFAAAQQLELTNKNSLAVNTGISVLSTQLTGQSVDTLA